MRLTRRRWLALSAGGAGALAVGIPLRAQDDPLRLEKVDAPGPVENRVNLVFVAEGFTKRGLGAFEETVDDLARRLLRHEIFTEYSNFFNIHRIRSASRSDWNGTGKGTRFGVKVGTQNRDLSVDWKKVYSQLPKNFPRKHVLILIVNHSEAMRAKGGGGPTAGRLACGSSWPVFLHEFGHALGHLGDEYPDGGPLSKYTVNVSMSKKDIPWQKMLGGRRNRLGIFKVEGIKRTFWRGEEDCLMGQDAEDFGPICRWGMVLGLHRHTRLLESAEPDEGTVDATKTGELRVRRLVPRGHDIDSFFVWRPASEVKRSDLKPETLRPRDLTRKKGWGTLRTAAGGDGLSVSTRNLPRGRNIVLAYARDNHRWIADDPRGSARDVRIWTVDSK